MQTCNLLRNCNICALGCPNHKKYIYISCNELRLTVRHFLVRK